MNGGQTEFRAALLDPACAVPAGLIDPSGRPAGRRFDVYRNNVVVGLIDALAVAFPVLRKIVGAENFAVLAGRFVRDHPPESPLIALYGAQMPAFLASFPPVRELGYLPDVARLELALRQSYHAADAAPVAADALAALPPDQLAGLRFRFAPAMRLVTSDWPIVAIWRFNTEDGAPRPQMAAETALITRPGFDPMPAVLTPAAGRFVAALAAGTPLGAAAETAAAEAPDFDLSHTLAALLGGGAITQLFPEEQTP